MRQAGGGGAFRALAGKFGLTDGDLDRLVAAFTPALQSGLEANMRDPAAFFRLMGELATANAARFYEHPESAFTDAGWRESRALMERIFQSEDVRRALAEQISAATGLAQAVAREALPALTAIGLGGIERVSRKNPFFEAMLRQAESAPRPPAGGGAAAKGPLDRYEEEQAEKERTEAGAFAQAFADNPFVKAYAEMVRQGTAGALDPSNPFHAALAAAAAPAAGEAGPDPAAGEALGRALLGDALESGRRMGEAYQKAVAAAFAAGKPKPD
nr:DUF937 domain-containing protein [Propylenella binzhouense]